MLCNDGENFGALPLKVTKTWASRKKLCTFKLLERFKCESKSENNKKKELRYIPQLTTLEG
jgi:hypothetical protein